MSHKTENSQMMFKKRGQETFKGNEQSSQY